jgi:hypothetical protein
MEAAIMKNENTQMVIILLRIMFFIKLTDRYLIMTFWLNRRHPVSLKYVCHCVTGTAGRPEWVFPLIYCKVFIFLIPRV